MVTLALAGDVMLGRGVNEALRDVEDPQRPWGDVLPHLLSADLRLVNLECAVTGHLQRWSRSRKVFHFRADPAMLSYLRAAHVDGCSLANNHTLDFEEVGLLDTLRYLELAGIRHAGAGRNLEEARQPALLEAGPLRVALIAVTDNEPAFAAGRERSGTSYLPVSLEPGVLRRVEEDIARAREAGAHLVVFSNHWGPNMVLRPPEAFRAFAHAVMDRGADVYFGHSAHVFQGVELYRGKPILYDTGDFLGDYAVDPELRNDWSFLFRVSFGGDGRFLGLELVPVELRYASMRLARGLTREFILERMEQLSAELGTPLMRHDERLWLEAPVLPELWA